MIKVDNIEVYGFEAAIRGMRNPMNSWCKSDSHKCFYGIDCDYCQYDVGKCSSYYIGDNDLDLMKRLYKSGPEHRKYLRMIHVSMDITAPLYWWKEFDTYKIGMAPPQPESDSCSTMHKIAAKEFELDDFSYEYLNPDSIKSLESTIYKLNSYRQHYKTYKDKASWWQMIQLLPSSYNQKRTIDMNYENVITIIKQRSGHKLDEWNNFVEILKKLPYVNEIISE